MLMRYILVRYFIQEAKMNRKYGRIVSTIAVIVIGFVSLSSLLAVGGKESEQPITEIKGETNINTGPEQTGQRQNVSANADLSSDVLASVENLQNAFRYVSKKLLPVVVEIDVVDIVQRPSGFTSPFDFFRRQENNDSSETQEFRQNGLGSGVIVRHIGNKVYILTNNHVVGDAEEISATLYDGRKFTATLVGRDEKTDLALITFTTKETVPVANLGDSDYLQVGDWVLAFGNPLGFESTVTSGIVSAIGRQSPSQMGTLSYTEYIQTDAAINQGNSGGALVNIRGEVVGINSWIASPSGGSIGIGFAIPINNAKQAIEDFITKGKVEYGWLGITVGEVSRQVSEDMKFSNVTGGFVFGVVKGSPADKAGLLPGDFITKIDSKVVMDYNDVTLTVGGIAPGESTDFEVVRAGEAVNINVKIAARDEDRIKQGNADIWPGLSVMSITDQIRDQLNVPKDAGNVIIGYVLEESPANKAGLQRGDIIKSINDTEVGSAFDFYAALNESGSRNYRLIVTRSGSEQPVNATLAK